MKRTSLYFVGPNKVELRQEELASPGAGQVQVRSLVSAISAGTEIMIYKGDAPQEMAADSQIAALGGSLAFPLKYGYSMVGEVTSLGEGVAEDWGGKKVFAFNPHESAFNASAENLLAIPVGTSVEDAAFLANLETAISLVHDGQPLFGEKIVVLGQGVVGLLTALLLGQHPLSALVVVDQIEKRRWLSWRLLRGESRTDVEVRPAVVHPFPNADLVYELSGNPDALNLGMDMVGENGRIVVGSWYGERFAHLKLGGKFHRGRIKITSSQVSQIDPGLRGRWDKARRFDFALQLISGLNPSRLVTHRYDFSEAGVAYQQLAQHPEETLAVLLQYPK